jgi:hypothetical protein
MWIVNYTSNKLLKKWKRKNAKNITLGVECQDECVIWPPSKPPEGRGGLLWSSHPLKLMKGCPTTPKRGWLNDPQGKGGGQTTPQNLLRGGLSHAYKLLRDGWTTPSIPNFFSLFFFVNNPLGYIGHFTWILLRNYPKIPRKILMKKWLKPETII